MNRSALLLVLPLLAGCNMHSKMPGDDDEAVSIKADENGNLEFNLPIVEGKMKLPAGVMHNGDVDIDGVKLMPGSKITGFSVFAADEGSNVDIAFSAPASPDQVRAYYVGEFKKQGLEVASAGDAVTGKSKDGSPFTIKVSPAPGGSQGKITVVDRD